MSFRIVRTLRTASSERFLVQPKDGTDGAVLDVHYLPNGDVAGTLIVLDVALQSIDQTQELLQFIDESLLPMASLNERNLSFTVVHGKVSGQFEFEK